MSLRCLIADDNAIFLEAAQALLEQEGICVVGTASNAADAARRAGELRPDVVLVDIRLGQDDGFALAHDLVDSGHVPSDGVILISTYAESDLADMITGSSATFLPKTALSGAAIRDILSMRHLSIAPGLEGRL